MNKLRRLAWSCILSLAILAVPGILASAKELAALTISGAGINGALALNNPQVIQQLQQYDFFDTTALAQAPQVQGEGYRVTGYLNLDGNSIPFVKGTYYPAAAGEQGYIHFTSGWDAAQAQATPVDRWGVVSPAAGAAFRDMLAARGVTLQVGVASAHTQASAAIPAMPAAPSSTLVAILASLTAVLLAGGMWAARRRTALS